VDEAEEGHEMVLKAMRVCVGAGVYRLVSRCP